MNYLGKHGEAVRLTAAFTSLAEEGCAAGGEGGGATGGEPVSVSLSGDQD